MFRSKRNRRKVDVAKKTGELKAAAANHGPWVLKLLALSAAFVAIAYGANEAWAWARTSPRFALRDVEVRGHAEATDVELVRLAAITLGQNLFAMDVRAMERAISTHPWVKAVSVTRRLPGKLTLEVTEHRPVALLSMGELYLVNEDAEPFKRAKAGDGFDLPLVTGLDRDAFAQRKEEALARLRAALTLVDAYAADPQVSGRPLSEVNLHPEGVTAVTADGEQIEFGEGDVLPKLGRLARVRQALRARATEAEVIHLDNRVRPSWVAVQVAVRRP